MSRDKQISEMAKVICLSYGKGVCLQCDDYEDCTVRQEAERLYNAGYRKSTDVALQVIGEIEEATNNHIKAISMLDPQNSYCAGGKKALDITLKVLAELKKKYTEEGK